MFRVKISVIHCKPDIVKVFEINLGKDWGVTFTQRGVDGRRDQRDEGFQVKTASSGLSFQQPVALLQVNNIRLLHCRRGQEEES